MIERMSRITLFLSSDTKYELLQVLQNFGHCHLDKMDEINSKQELIQKKESIERALSTLKSIRRQSRKYEPAQRYTGSADSWIVEVLEGADQIEKLQTKHLALDKQLHSANAWNSLKSAQMIALRKAGIPLRLYSISKDDYHHLQNELQEAFVEVGESHEVLFLLQIKAVSDQIVAKRYLKELIYPAEGIETLQKEKDEIQQELERLKAWLLSGITYIRFLRNLLAETEDSIQMMKAIHAFEENSFLCTLRGWVPRRYLQELERKLSIHPVVMIAERPRELHEIPISLRHNKMGRLFLPLTRLFSLPSYTELDPTLFFAPFFTIYFGICGADIGYGLILLSTALLTRFISQDQSIKDFASLSILLGLSTSIAGVAYGVFFGSPLSEITLLRPISNLTVFKDNASAFSFALFIGVVQLMTGYALRMINRVVQLGSAGWLQPLGILLFLSGIFWVLMIPYGGSFSPAGLNFGYFLGEIARTSLLPYVLIGVGVLLILFFSDLKLDWWKRPLNGFWELYNLATSVPTDVLSYLRLFALGLSGALLGNAVNQVASGIYSDSWYSWAFMALVWVFGHSINLGLVMLSAFVHPLRLTFVEFYKSMEFKGGGKLYQPFVKSLKKSYSS